MRIGFDAKRAFQNASGLGSYSRNTLYALRQYDALNQLVLFTPDTANRLLEDTEQFEIITPKPSSLPLYKSVWRSFRMNSAIAESGIEIFHGLSNELPRGIGKTGIPSVVTVHDLIFLRYPEYYRPIDRKIYASKVRYACNRTNRIIAISTQTRDDLVELLDIPAEKIEVLHQSISTRFFDLKLTGDVKEKYNLPDKFILSVGTLESRKNQMTLLKALAGSQLKVPVIFVGKQTRYSGHMKRFIATNKMENQVRFLENIPENDLAALYRHAQLSVYISEYEGFGLPVAEAMACGCPVITSNVSCLPETAGDAALLCDPADARGLGNQINRLLTTPSLAVDLTEKGKERAKAFHPREYAQNLISLYSGIIK